MRWWCNLLLQRIKWFPMRLSLNSPTLCWRSRLRLCSLPNSRIVIRLEFLNRMTYRVSWILQPFKNVTFNVYHSPVKNKLPLGVFRDVSMIWYLLSPYSQHCAPWRVIIRAVGCVYETEPLCPTVGIWVVFFKFQIYTDFFSLYFITIKLSLRGYHKLDIVLQRVIKIYPVVVSWIRTLASFLDVSAMFL